jgi:hypothetical protein
MLYLNTDATMTSCAVYYTRKKIAKDLVLLDGEIS